MNATGAFITQLCGTSYIPMIVPQSNECLGFITFIHNIIVFLFKVRAIMLLSTQNTADSMVRRQKKRKKSCVKPALAEKSSTFGK